MCACQFVIHTSTTPEDKNNKQNTTHNNTLADQMTRMNHKHSPQTNVTPNPTKQSDTPHHTTPHQTKPNQQQTIKIKLQDNIPWL